MNKHELAVALAERSDISQRDAAMILENLLGLFKESLEKEGDKITLRGFGCLEVVMAGARTGRNIHNNEVIPIPARPRIRFKSYSDLPADAE